MRKEFNIDKVKENSAQAISSINTLLDDYMKIDLKKADLLSYWLRDYAKFLKKENDFNPKSLRRYKRGEVIKAHLGYNIGCEEGGLHYCVILDNNNPYSSDVITVVPLTSVKENKDVTHLRYGEVYLGSDLRDKIEEKFSYLSGELYRRFASVIDFIDAVPVTRENTDEIHNLIDMSKIVNNIAGELSHMKNGSIALVSQITTISKIRIYDPKTNRDALAKIRLSDHSLNAIDKKLKELYTYKK